jgi:hypothetical protein
MENLLLDKVSIYPNPFAKVALIDIIFSEEKNVSIEVITGDGEVQKKIYNGNVAANFNYKYFLDGDSMLSGEYFLKVSAGENTDFKRINLIRQSK